MQNKRLLQINVTANVGSTGRIAEQIGEVAMARGWDSYIAYGRECTTSKSRLIRIGSRLAFYWHALMTRLFDRHGLASRWATRRLIHTIEQIKPTLIHLHNIHGYYLHYPELFAYLQRNNIPVVWTLHDCWPFTGHCAHYTYVQCMQWKTHCQKCLFQKSYPASWLWSRATNNFKEKRAAFTSLSRMVLVPVSKWLDNEIADSFLRKYPRQVISNGIDLDQFKETPVVKQELGFTTKFLILGVAGVWTDRKGLSDFLKLRELLPASFQICLIGLNEQQVRSLPEGIIGICRTNSVAELARYYSVADVFVNPTWEDTFPTTNIEAMACGTPVITYRTGGAPESVTAETGFVIEQGDLTALVAAIYKIMARGKNYYAKECRCRVQRYYDKKQAFLNYVDLYEQMVNCKVGL